MSDKEIADALRLAVSRGLMINVEGGETEVAARTGKSVVVLHGADPIGATLHAIKRCAQQEQS